MHVRAVCGPQHVAARVTTVLYVWGKSKDFPLCSLLSSHGVLDPPYFSLVAKEILLNEFDIFGNCKSHLLCAQTVALGAILISTVCRAW